MRRRPPPPLASRLPPRRRRSSPSARGDRYFYSKRLATQNQSVIYMRAGLSGKEEVLIDPNQMSADQTTSAGVVDITEDGKWLAYGIRQGGKDENTIHFLDVDARKDLPEKIELVRDGTNKTPTVNVTNTMTACTPYMSCSSSRSPGGNVCRYRLRIKRSDARATQKRRRSDSNLNRSARVRSSRDSASSNVHDHGTSSRARQMCASFCQITGASGPDFQVCCVTAAGGDEVAH